MEEFTVVTVIGRPVEDVYAVLTDVAKIPLWTPGVREARQTSDGPLAPGSTMVSGSAGRFRPVNAARSLAEIRAVV